MRKSLTKCQARLELRKRNCLNLVLSLFEFYIEFGLSVCNMQLQIAIYRLLRNTNHMERNILYKIFY